MDEILTQVPSADHLAAVSIIPWKIYFEIS